MILQNEHTENIPEDGVAALLHVVILHVSFFLSLTLSSQCMIEQMNKLHA